MSEPVTHFAESGPSATLETCRRQGGEVTSVPKLVTCPRCRTVLLRETARGARRVREGFLTVEQVMAVIEAGKTRRDRALIAVMYFCALRASEIGLLKLADLDEEKRVLYTTRLKGSVSRFYAVAPFELWLKPWVRELRATPPFAAGPLFPGTKPWKGLSRWGVFALWRRTAKRAGLGRAFQHPHILKHSIASHLLEAGEPITSVQNYIGHRDIRNTQIYAEVGETLKDKLNKTVESLLK